VALKIAVFPSDPRFNREVELLSRNPLPGMPRLLDRGSWQASDEVSHPFIVMEWIRGRSLYEWARVHNPSCRDMLRTVAQVARTLEALHQGECLHRDVKGDNIMVEPEGRAVLMDFGSGTWKGAPPLTEWVVPPNTRVYRSPESLRFEWRHFREHGAIYETRPTDDLYALGVAAYRLVTGVYPPPGTDPEALKAQSQEPLPQRRPVHELNRRVVPELAALIERMLANEPEARGTAREIAEAAEAAAEHAGPEADVPFLDLEWPEARAQAVPAPAMPVPAVEPPKPPASKAHGGVPAAEQADSDDQSLEWRRVFMMAVMSLAVVVPCCMSPRSNLSLIPPDMAQAEDPAVEMAPDGGTRGVGEEVLSARVDSQQIPNASEPVSKQVPQQPFSSQRRPPCRGGEVIHGGCWMRLPNIKPPCRDNEYEWQGLCYYPILDQTRAPTSEESK
jgi:serine/threonine protein kinase